VRHERSKRFFAEAHQLALISGVDVENIDSLMRVIGDTKPDVVINCIGLVKQLAEAEDPLAAIPINSLLPHRIARLCAVADARLVHMSTDCVFSGSKGMYSESDQSDAKDLYGRSKFLGEVDYPNAITLRTSIIGHELEGARSLVGWFLSQSGSVRGFKKAIFSGLPTVEIARLIRDFVLPDPHLHGLYHVSADPINKYDLLGLIADAYGKRIEIVLDESYFIDRSLDSARFRSITGFEPKPWVELVRSMRDFG
jgi:dTDP-4-dehydrorhamnose reductase